jgi:hypothetical protein
VISTEYSIAVLDRNCLDRLAFWHAVVLECVKIPRAATAAVQGFSMLDIKAPNDNDGN